ncbi:MAG: pimeloyl-ACP methyl ester carboxylesterase [Luteibaculaceae bacterium]|jgi:pimeloyl-ACP methyl ester carboxylesterase
MDGVWYRGNERPIVWDFEAPLERNKCKGVVVFCHGYKGFKDWGGFAHMSKFFVENGFALFKFNFSCNGGTAENPIDFPDLTAFGENTFSQEIADLHFVFDQIQKGSGEMAHYQNLPLHLIGHSRGGGMAILTANALPVVSFATWAAVSDFAPRFPADVSEWQKNGVAYIQNARTGQDMPHLFSFYQDFKDNQARLSIPNYAQGIQKPWFLAHGTGDTTVGMSEAERLAVWGGSWVRTCFIEGSSHTFGCSQPWISDSVPTDFRNLIVSTISFFESNQ